MADSSKLSKIQDLLTTAEISLKAAKKMMSEAFDIDASESHSPDRELYVKKAADLSFTSSSAGGRVIEGVFNGQGMVDQKGNAHPVPANYASKSKLIPGDVLKLTITEDGKFMYKQIGPVERKTIVGPLVYTNNQYQVLANGKAYKVLLASVTYFRAEVGDEVTLIIPANEESDWGAIEAVLPKFEESTAEEVSVKASKRAKKPVSSSPESLDQDEEFKI